ncbi:hypothetical protein B0H13DRAFT_2668241 [Mycena leptocephala]|nr:hypothetical protein B0H13DRAFT_2668241 [Mycena leptocephala]
MSSGTGTNYYISHVSGGTGGAGGRGGSQGGGGGAGHGPSFQAETIVFHNDPQERDKIIEWASPLNFFPRQADIFSSRQPGTGEWLLQDSLFKRWKAGEIRTLWCRGIPGAGKTVLTSIVVDDLRANLGNENTGIGVLYLDHKATAETQSPSNLLAALWRQLALEEPISADLNEIYRRHRAQGTRLSLEETYSMLHSMVSDFSSVFIVVDALDEYPEDDRDTLLRRLWTLGPAVKLMLTSRPHINIDHIISNVKTLDVHAIEDDIRKYVEAQIEKCSRLSRHVNNSSMLRDSIEEKIVKRSDGMFLLAKLHIQSLMTKQNVAAVQDALANLSSGLDGTYDAIVERINQQSEDDRQLAWRTLSWVFNAKIPLQPSELQEALAVEPEATLLNPDHRTDMDIILSVCAGLVVVKEADHWHEVRLIHYSTQTYLQSMQSTLFPYAQCEITLICMTYMRLTSEASLSKLEDPVELLDANPFFDYAVEYCLVHARGKAETEIPDQILEFLGNCSVWRRFWNLYRWRDKDKLGPDKLWIALAFGLEVISSYILLKDGPGRSLEEAASRGDTDAIRFLLKNVENEGGAFVNAVGGEYGSALGAAVWNGHELAVKLLIEHGANVNTSVREYGNTLHAAVGRGHEVIGKILLQHGADVNAKAGAHGSLLQPSIMVMREATSLANTGNRGHGPAVSSSHDILFLTLLALKESADAFPPLKRVMSGVTALFVISERAKHCKSDARDIFLRTMTIIDVIADSIPDGSAIPPPLLISIERFTVLLDEIRGSMKVIALSSGVSRIVHLNRNERILQDIKTKLDEGYRDLVAASSLRVETQPAVQQTQTLFNISTAQTSTRNLPANFQRMMFYSRVSIFALLALLLGFFIPRD